MVYQVSDIIRDVRVCLDYNKTDSALITANDEATLRLDDIIRSKILGAVERVHSAAPYQLLEVGHNIASPAFYWETTDTTSPRYGCGWIVLPNDFMRLVVFQMEGWDRGVYDVMSAESEEYSTQRSRVAGVRGNPQRPVCVLGMRPEGKVLEFYSVEDQDTARMLRGVYVPYPTIDSNDGVDLSRWCYEAVVYEAAGLTLMTYGEQEKATMMMGLADTFLKR